MAAFELEYLQHTYVNNIVNECIPKCDDDICCCLDILQLSVLSLVLKDIIKYPDGRLYNFYDSFHIIAKNDGKDVFTINKCNRVDLKNYSDEGIFFDRAKNKKEQLTFGKIITLERRSIDFLGVAVYLLNVRENDSEKKTFRDCNKLLLDLSLLNPRLLLIVSFNMFYGLLIEMENAPGYQQKDYIEKYIRLIKNIGERIDSIYVRELRDEIIGKYQEIFKDNLYNMVEISDRFPEYFCAVTFEKNQIEEVNVLGNLSFLCAVLEQFSVCFIPEKENKEIFSDYVECLNKIMNINITQDTKYLEAQYRKEQIYQLNKTEDFKKAIEDYCSEKHLFIVDTNSKGDKEEDENNKKKIVPRKKGIFQKIGSFFEKNKN